MRNTVTLELTLEEADVVRDFLIGTWEGARNNIIKNGRVNFAEYRIKKYFPPIVERLMLTSDEVDYLKDIYLKEKEQFKESRGN